MALARARPIWSSVSSALAARGPLQAVCEAGVIDEIADGWAEALVGADFVLVATPVGQMDAVMAAMAPHLEAQTVVTDAGSTKRDVIEAAYRHLDANLASVVPSHPIAGAEKSGVAPQLRGSIAARRSSSPVFRKNDPAAVERVGAIWRACGAVLCEMSPQEHDRVFAAVSHLPHLLAFGLVHDLAQRANAEQLFSYAASGFRDFTRIAGGHPEMWRDICACQQAGATG